MVNSSRLWWHVLAMAVLSCAGFNSWADKQSRLISRIDTLNQEMAAFRAVPEKIDMTIEELRKDLFKSAVETRDAKKLSDDIESAIASGSSASAELAQLRTDIVNAGRILRELRDQLEQLSKINKSSREMTEDFEAQLESLRKTVVDPDAAVESAGEDIVKGLKAEIKDLKSQVAERDRSLERLLRDYNSLAVSSEKPQTVNLPAADSDPSLAAANNLLASGKIDEALASFKKSYSLNPDSMEAQMGMAACYFEQGNLEDAEHLVKSVLELDKKNARAQGLHGAVLYRKGNLREARKTLEKAVRADETNAYNYNYLGVVLNEMGRADDAIEQIEHAVEIDPQYISALYNLAILLATDQEPDVIRAKAYYDKALSLGSPRNQMLDELLGIMQEK